MTVKNDIWITLHYESGQVPMMHIRNAFRAYDYDLVRWDAPAEAWTEVHQQYTKLYPGRPEQVDWKAFREAAERLGYGPTQISPKAQEGQGRHLREAPRPAGKVEARSRMASGGQRVRWKSLISAGFVYPPQYAGDVGMDLAATEDTTITPDEITYVPLGVAFAAPPGYWILLLGRSSLAFKFGVAMVPGVIDNGYRGEMLAGLYAVGPRKVRVAKGTRVAQAILMPVVTPNPEQVNWLPDSDRGHNGFGSTGGH